MVERQLQQYCTKMLRSIGFYVTVFSSNRQVQRQLRGVPDSYAVGFGLSLWIDYKARTDLTPEQEEFFKMINDKAGDDTVALKARSWEDIESVLRARGIIA